MRETRSKKRYGLVMSCKKMAGLMFKSCCTIVEVDVDVDVVDVDADVDVHVEM